MVQKRTIFYLLLFALAAFLAGNGAHAEWGRGKHRITLFAGRYTSGSMGESANPFTAEHEDYYTVSASYIRRIYSSDIGFEAGPELGLGGRFGRRRSVEIWCALYMRLPALSFRDYAAINPAVSAGLSAIDRAVGAERERERRNEGDASLLFYLGPEIVLHSPRKPNWELVYRLHHRSGAHATLGELREGYNANVIGLRCLW